MLDNQRMKCINMMLFTDVVKLGPILFDKSSIAAMKDNYMLFSWNSFVKLLAAQRFDGATYVFPFMLLLNAIRSKNLNKKDRFNFLSIAIKHFYLRQVDKSDPKDFFTPTFHNASSIGTLFGDRIFIIRCINTCVAIAVALDIGADYEFFFALSRLGTHDVEYHYGKVRILSSFNHSFDNVVSVTTNAMLLNDFCHSLNYKFKIRTRDNEGGAVITDKIWNLPCINTDFNYISDTLYFLFESIKLSETQIKTFEYFVNSYSEIADMRQYPRFKVDKMFCGSLPFYRYMTNFYVQSLLPIPSCLNVTSPLDFFIKNPKMSKRIQKVQTQQWFSRLVCMIANIKSIGGEIQAIPFLCINPLQTNADIYKHFSFLLKKMLNKLPGEVINIDNIELQPKEPVNTESILRLDDSFNKYSFFIYLIFEIGIQFFRFKRILTNK